MNEVFEVVKGRFWGRKAREDAEGEAMGADVKAVRVVVEEGEEVVDKVGGFGGGW